MVVAFAEPVCSRSAFQNQSSLPASRQSGKSIGESLRYRGPARDFGQLCRAFALVHQRYLERGYTKENDCGMRYSVWNFLSSSITLVVEEETKILGTLTIVLDTDCNIPAGSDFKSECEMLRNQGRLIAEATMFACEESPGQMGEVPAVLMALAYRWCLEAGVDDLCMVVNPRHLFFYERVLGFERMGEAKAMNYVEGNAGLFLRLDLQRAKSKSLKSTCAARVITAGSSVGKLCFNRYELTQVEAAVLLDCAPELYFEARPEHQAILEGLYPLACQSLISCYRYVDPLEVGLA